MKIIIIIIIVVVILLAYLGTSAYFAAIVMKIPRISLDDSPASVGLNYEDVSFPSRADNITLSGWYIPGGGENTIIMVSGSVQNRIESDIGVLKMSRDLVGRGFNILLFDLRGRGESEGKGLMMTHADRDIGGAVDYIKSRNASAENIGIIGFSTGAASALIFAGQENIAVVSDSCFADVSEMLVRVGVKERGLPESLVQFFKPGVFLMARIIYGYKRVDPVDIVAEASCPILFIHGEADDLIPVNNAYELYEASDNPSDQVWIVPGATHCQAYNTNPVGYIDEVISFLR